MVKFVLIGGRFVGHSADSGHSIGARWMRWHDRFDHRGRRFDDGTRRLVVVDGTGAVAAAQAAALAVVGAERRIDGGTAGCRHDRRGRLLLLLLLVGVVQFAGVFLQVEIAAKSLATNAARELSISKKQNNHF